MYYSLEVTCTTLDTDNCHCLLIHVIGRPGYNIQMGNCKKSWESFGNGA